MSHATAPLSEVCSFRHGGTPSKGNASYWGGTIPWISPKDMKASVLTASQDTITEAGVSGSAASVVPEGSILVVARSGILAHTLPVALAGRPLAFNQDIKAIQVTSEKVLGEYVYWFIRGREHEVLTRGVKKGATVHSLQSGYLEGLDIPLVPLPEQRRIVDLLSRAENIVRMRREAEQKAKEIIPALFLDMFGDPARNPKNWPIEPLAEVAAIESPLRTPDLVTEATDVCIGPDSIESMTGQLLSQPTVGDIRPISGKYRYRCRDVLYSKIRPALVKVALAPSDGYCSADMYPLRCAPRARPEYLQQILLNKHFTRYALDRATRAQMPKINREALFAYRLPVPPTDLQDAFTRYCQGYGRVREQQRQALRVTEQAFQSLLAGVFGKGRDRQFRPAQAASNGVQGNGFYSRQ